jgi:hypothetical protein
MPFKRLSKECTNWIFDMNISMDRNELYGHLELVLIYLSVESLSLRKIGTGLDWRQLAYPSFDETFLMRLPKFQKIKRLDDQDIYREAFIRSFRVGLTNGYKNHKQPNVINVPPAIARLAQPFSRISLPNKSTSSAIAHINGIMAVSDQPRWQINKGAGHGSALYDAMIGRRAHHNECAGEGAQVYARRRWQNYPVRKVTILPTKLLATHSVWGWFEQASDVRQTMMLKRPWQNLRYVV